MARFPTRLPLFVALASTLSACAPVGPEPAAPAGLDAALAAFVTRLERAEPLRGKKLAVGVFVTSQGQASALGGYVADRLDAALASRTARGFDVVSRRYVCQVIEDSKLFTDGRLDPDVDRKLGPLTAVDVLILGQLAVSGSRAAATARMVETETGRALLTDRFVLPLDAELTDLASRPVAAGGCAY